MPGPKAQAQKDFNQLLMEKLKAASRNPTLYGYVPHPKQTEFHANMEQGRVFIGGNRSGKTVAGAVELLRAATGTDPYRKFPEPPLRLRGVSVDRKQGIDKIMVPEIARWCPPSALINGSWENSYNNANSTLTFENGSFIEFLTYEMDVEKHAGTSRHAIWFDEEAPELIFQEGMGRLVDTGGIWWMTMTPVEGMEWIFQLYNAVEVEGENRHVHFTQVDSYQNPHIQAQQIDALFSNLSQEEKDARTRGMFAALGGKIYPHFSDKNIVDLSDWSIPSHFVKINAMDHGFRNPTAWLFAAINPSENEIFVYDEYYEKGLVVDAHAKNILRREIAYGLPTYRVGDPAIRAIDAISGTSIQHEYTKHGLYITLGNNDVKAGIDRVAKLMGDPKSGRPQLYISSRCTNLIQELRKYRWANYAHRKMEATRNKKEEPVKKDDHATDALRYLCAAWLDWQADPPLDQVKAIHGPSALPSKNHGDSVSFDEYWGPDTGPENSDNSLGSDW